MSLTQFAGMEPPNDHWPEFRSEHGVPSRQRIGSTISEFNHVLNQPRTVAASATRLFFLIRIYNGRIYPFKVRNAYSDNIVGFKPHADEERKYSTPINGNHSAVLIPVAVTITLTSTGT